MIKKYINIIATVLIALGIYYFAVRANWLPSPGKLFRAAPVVIDNTPILIKEIRQLSQLVTLTAFDEVVVSSVKPSPVGSVRQLIQFVSPIPAISADRLVLVVKGSVQVGTDLGSITDQQVFVKDDSVSLQVPAARILLVTTNPSGTETFIEEGDWKPEEVNQLKLKAAELLKSRALEKGLLKKADAQALLVLRNFLKALGYRKIRVVTSQ
ncbi:DUF4230 domain-containing protein [Flavihumibacter fluvii]|uniref:DUF4230 domain-containing protein n=1 Tax=Flavihumibacter fluvii TaxID=2838157 RepID=UPI001BDE678D|nr:DUF4230 domain-containing protein [Flavihumibacter fluvii]ULQ54652.1 DUF4230 domain-containing protein [Flavihumibacter fluvii]